MCLGTPTRPCCAFSISVRQQSLDEFSTATRSIVRNALVEERRQELRTCPDGPYDDNRVVDNLAKTCGLFFSDPIHAGNVLVAQGKLQSVIRSDAWFANSMIAEVHSLSTFILPPSPRVMQAIRRQSNGDLYASWSRLLRLSKMAHKHRIFVDNIWISMEELRIVPQFDHTTLCQTRLKRGRMTKCLCNKEHISWVFLRKIGGFCWVTGNTYTEKSAARMIQPRTHLAGQPTCAQNWWRPCATDMSGRPSCQMTTAWKTRTRTTIPTTIGRIRDDDGDNDGNEYELERPSQRRRVGQ